MKKKFSCRFLILGFLLMSLFITGCSEEAVKDMAKEAVKQAAEDVLDAAENELLGDGLRTDSANNGTQKDDAQNEQQISQLNLADLPQYSGEPYVVINNNEPVFSEDELTVESYESYSELDEFGRCGVAIASVGQDLMPTEKRGSISSVKPTGWHSVTYDCVDGGSLYNRCHLLGYQLTGENANKENLITGTRYMNVEGMLPFEDMVADYVKETGEHVAYRVTPIFEGDNLVASGVQMEAYSVEDEGESVCYNVYVYNVQPGVTIDYATGDNWLTEDAAETTGEDAAETVSEEIRGNKKSKVYHCPGQAAYEEMADSKNLVIFSSEEEAIKAGYRKAQR